MFRLILEDGLAELLSQPHLYSLAACCMVLFLPIPIEPVIFDWDLACAWPDPPREVHVRDYLDVAAAGRVVGAVVLLVEVAEPHPRCT